MRKLLLLCATFLFSFALFAQQTNLIFRESYRLADVQNLVMALNSENVEVKNFRGYKVTVEAYSNNSSRSPIIKRANKSIIIEHSKEHFYKADYCNLVIYIPYDYQLNSFDYISDSGNLSAEDLWASRLTARSNTGSISFNSVVTNDTFSIKSTRGNIKIGRYKGEYFEMTSESGSIGINKVQAEYFNASSGSGEIYLNLEGAPVASSQVKSSRGNIIVEIPATENFNLQVLSNSGTFRDNIKNIRKSARGEHEFKYNEGGALLTLQTTSGDITLE
jgi:hypothetical protein